MTPAQTIAAASSSGVHLVIRDGQLVARPKELRAELKAHRERILQILLLPESSPLERLHWEAFDHVCSTACTRPHVICNACGMPLRSLEQHWPHLHPNCRLELADGC